jgi:glycosyltransferase involved in cell wall biosynthesis
VHAFGRENPLLAVRCVQNSINLGYDANLRTLLDNAVGEFCMFVGDDDLLCPGAIAKVLEAVQMDNVGFVLRAWKSVDRETLKEEELHNYFSGDRVFPPGAQSVAALYRRSVFISGLVVHRAEARKHHTDRFDGLLLYQLHLMGCLLAYMNARYIDQCLALRLVGGEHFFGTSEKERHRFKPGMLLPEHSLHFVEGLLLIARALDSLHPGVLGLIEADLGRYSYAMLEIQRRRLGVREFGGYVDGLARLGLGKTKMFWLYAGALTVAGPGICTGLIRTLKRALGRTPNLGGNSGVRVERSLGGTHQEGVDGANRNRNSAS